MNSESGELSPEERHPATQDAVAYIVSLGVPKLLLYQEVLGSLALSGNNMGIVCSSTLHRVLSKMPVGERYILGLAWYLKILEEAENPAKKHLSPKKGKKHGR